MADYFCFKCRKKLDISNATSVARKETCPSCDFDLHACVNCRFYDPSAYNECRESQAERVVDKHRSNFCDYFSYVEGERKGEYKDPKANAMKKLDDLFK